jgi:hypothetical protein
MEDDMLAERSSVSVIGALPPVTRAGFGEVLGDAPGRATSQDG